VEIERHVSVDLASNLLASLSALSDQYAALEI